MKSTTLLLWLFSILFCTPYFAEEEFGAETTPQGAREFSVPVAEVLQVPVYLTQNGYGEVVVRAAGKGSDFKEHDHLTHADGIRILNGGLDTFIQSGEQEVVVPVIDDEADDLHGEGKLLGFVMLTSVIPRKLSARRGDLVYDLEEGGEQPSLQVGNIMLSSSGATNKGDKDYTPPPHGGGSCITDRDCYYAKGDCVAGKCVCEEPLTGSFCQLYRPGRSSLSPLAKREQDADAARFHSSVNENKVELTRRADQKLAAQQAKMQQLSAASKHRGGHQGGKNEHFGFAFGKGPPLSRTGGTATALKEARGLRHNIGGGSGLDGQRVLPPGRAGASLHAAVGGDGGGGDSIQHQRQRLREREKEKEQARASSLPANTNDNGIEAAGGGDRGGVPTLQDLQRQSQEERGKAATATATNNNDNNNNAVSADSDSGNGSSGKAKAKAKTKVKTKVKAKAKSPSSPQQEQEQEQEQPSSASASASASASSSASAPEGEKSELLQQYERGELDLTDTRIRFKVERAKREEETRLARIEERKRREAGARAARAGEDATQRDMEEFQRELKKIEVTEPDKRADPGAKEAMHRQNQQANMATMDDLYGPGKAYPEPYAAGKVPPELVHARHKARHENRPFIFSVRYRSGPLGLSFDNKPADRTVVERVGKSMQSDLSDVQAGDRVLSVDQYNVTNASAKMTQRIMSSLGWPRVVVFEVKSSEAVEKMAAEESLKQRSLNLSVVFPPTVQGQYPARTPQWTPLLTPNSFAYGDAGGATTTQACPLFLVQSTQDEFGCDVNIPPEDYSLPWQVVQMGRQHLRETGRDWRSWGPPVSESVQVGLEGEGKSEVGVHDDVDRAAFDEKTDYYTVHAELFPMLAMTLLQASEQQIAVDLHSMVVMKRGICTFVSKSSRLRKNGASAGVIVNTEEKLDDMQKGKGDDTTNCHAPTAIVQEEAGTLLHVATLKVSQRGDYSSNGPKTASPEVLALAGDDTSLTPSCERIRSLVDELMDLWPHSVPRLTTDQLLSEAQRKAVSNHPRPQADEGGRLAVGGDNGWAFFDYHIAMFGEQEVPLGPHRLQMALPPHGCDPSAYQVRIKDSIVAILRGGGCSFGIKVINAQRLGARAVVIVNTDESKNMRLMALPDEEPQISIPCVMVSRRFQYYLEGQMRRYWVNDQHLISLQPTGVFGNYEERSLEVRRGRGG